jgi:hypothetical protein
MKNRLKEKKTQLGSWKFKLELRRNFLTQLSQLSCPPALSAEPAPSAPTASVLASHNRPPSLLLQIYSQISADSLIDT